jgi:AAA domain
VTFEIKAARREMARARIGLCGPAGSGKTYSALLLARGLGLGLFEKLERSHIGVIDTERKSAALYSDLVDFDTIEMSPPYSPQRYCEAIDAFEQHGTKILVIDQISHAWSGPGGLLEFVDTLKVKERNAMSPWRTATPEQNRFVDRMLRSECHIIATMRSKAEWVIEEQFVNGHKKQVPRKIGLAPVQRDGIEYEFTSMLELDVSGNTATASKDRTRLFTGFGRLDEEAGRRLARWLQSGAPASPEPAPRAEEELQEKLTELGRELDYRTSALVNDEKVEIPYDDLRLRLREALLREAGVKGRPTLEQVEKMLDLVPHVGV